MSYEVYRFIHIASIIVFFCTAGIMFFERPASLIYKIVNGLTSLGIIAGGMGMMARLELVKNGWPTWLVAKLIIWFILAAMVPVLSKRFEKIRGISSWLTMGLGLVAVYIVMHKPF